MKRRVLLASMGAGMAGTAGCLTGNSNKSENTPKEDVGTPIEPATPTGKRAEFELTGISATGNAEVGKEYTFEVTVKNTGDQPGVYRAPARVKTGDSVQYKDRAMAMVYVEPGKTKTAAVSLPPFESVGNANVRFATPENTWQVDIVGPDLAMGESFRVDGFEITYESVEFRDSVTYELGGLSTEQTYTPAGGGQFAVVIVKVESVGRSSWMGDADKYTVVLDGNERSPYTDAGYNKRSLSEGQTQRVELPYEVPGDVSKSDLIFKYSGVRANKYARWSPGFVGRSSGSDADGTGDAEDETTTQG